MVAMEWCCYGLFKFFDFYSGDNIGSNKIYGGIVYGKIYHFHGPHV